MAQQRNQMSETLITGALLAAVGGFLDAYSYLAWGGVFANAQTGNIVLLGVRAAQGDFTGALYYLLPISAFVLGVLVAELVCHRFGQRGRFHWRQVIVAVEALTIAGIAFFPSESWDTPAVLLISFLCALQVQSFRTVHGLPYATTMCTGNLRSASELLYQYRRTGRRELLTWSMRYFAVVLFFVLGAALGAWLTALWAAKAALFGCLGLFAVFLLLFYEQREQETENKQ